jgi:hypothetical protein
MTVNANPAQSEFGSAEELFRVKASGWWWDVMPDGERFLFLETPPANRALELIIQ